MGRRAPRRRVTGVRFVDDRKRFRLADARRYRSGGAGSSSPVTFPARSRTGGRRMEFEDRILIVTGAAGGIGLATARELASLGARLIATDVDGGRLDRELGAIAAVCEPGDLTDPAVRQRVVE